MKRANVAVPLLLVLIVACGGSKSRTTTSGIKNRAFVANLFSGALDIVDASSDVVSASTISVGTQPTMMTLSPDRAVTVVFNAGANSAAVITNSSEALAGTIQLPDFTESIVAKDANTGYAAIPNASVLGQPLGAVVQLDLKSFTKPDCGATPAVLCIPVARARRLVLNHAGSKLLIFSDNSDSVTVVDTATNAAQSISGFDRPVSGVFSADDSTAFILNCGPECGGSRSEAGVAVLNVSTQSITSTLQLPGAGATTALLNGSNLYVAGTVGGTGGAGTLSVLNVSSPTPSASAPIAIGDGFHNQMVLGSNNKLFVGATGCTNDPNSPAPSGCLSIFDTAANTAIVDTARDPAVCAPTGPCSASKGFVTGMAAVAGRSVVYVVEGNRLRVFDATSSSEIVNKISIFGQVSDVKLVDQ